MMSLIAFSTTSRSRNSGHSCSRPRKSTLSGSRQNTRSPPLKLTRWTAWPRAVSADPSRSKNRVAMPCKNRKPRSVGPALWCVDITAPPVQSNSDPTPSPDYDRQRVEEERRRGWASVSLISVRLPFDVHEFLQLHVLSSKKSARQLRYVGAEGTRAPTGRRANRRQADCNRPCRVRKSAQF